MSKRELGDLTPIRAALDEIVKLEGSAFSNDAQRALTHVRERLQKALDLAVNPEIRGLTVEEYARSEGITKDGAYKRIRRGVVKSERRAGVGLVVVDDAA